MDMLHASMMVNGVLEQIPTRELKVKFLHPSGPATSLSYPRKDDVLILPRHAILSTVSPVTVTGRTYTLSNIEIAETTMCLK